MAATVKELIKKGFNIQSKGLSTSFKHKIEIFSSHFGSIKSFLSAKKEDFEKLIFVIDNPNVRLSDKDYEKIKAFQESGFLDSKLSVQQNFVKVLTAEFVNRQLAMIENLDLETLNVNPILAGALNLDNETDLIRYYAYQAISRSVVTSVGFLVQNLILYSSENVHEGKEDELGEQTKWDVVVEKIDEVKAYLEIKSGTNDINIFVTEKDVLCFFLEKDYLLNKIWIYDILYFNKKALIEYIKLVNHVINFLKNSIDLKFKDLIKI